MAVTLKGFSIREYAANMRSVNFDDCWPFNGIDKELTTKSLPQISVQKFRFWSNELKNNEKVEEKSKGKQKTPKKRSIVEIFAVSPPVRVDAKKRKIKKKGNCVKKKIKVEIYSAKKGKRNKRTSSAHIFHKLKDSVHKKISGKNSKDTNDNKKKPLHMNNLAKNRKLKLLQSSKLISKKQRKQGKGFQVHNILKSPTKGPIKKACVHESEKHANSCSHIDIPQLRNLCKIFSDVLAASSMLENTQANNTTANNDTNATKNTAERSDGVLTDKEQLSESCSDTAPPISEDELNVDRVTPSNGVFDVPKIMKSIHSENLSSCSENQAKESSLKTPDSQTHATIRGKCSSSNGLENDMRHLQPCVEPTKDSSWTITEFLPMRSSLPICREKHINDSFVGLPLNSQGELIDFQSSSNFGFREMGPNYPCSRNNVDFQNIIKGKFSSVNANQQDQLSWIQEPYINFRKPAISHERFGAQNNETYHGCREDNHTRNYIDKVNFQPEGNDIFHVTQSNNQNTMRLMGTNVIIDGGINKGSQSFDNGRIWTDKEVISNRPSAQQWATHQSFHMPNNDTYLPFDSSSNFFPKSNFLNFDYRPQWISRSNITSTSGNDMKMGHQFPINYKHMLLNSTHCNHSQGISCNATSTYRPPPFLYQANLSSIQQPPMQSSQNLPPWLFSANLQRKTQEISCSCYANPIGSHQNFGKARMDTFPFRLPYSSSNVPLPVSTATSSHRKSRAAVDNTSGTKNLNRDGTNFSFTYLKSLDNSSKSRKRPATNDIEFVRPTRKQFPRMQENTSAPVHSNTLNSNNMVGAQNSIIANEELRTPFLSSSSKNDGGLRCGPVKLSAGAKHVLKPGLDINQDYSTPTHSTVPFYNALDVSMTGSEIYRF